jgi:hypothetical protein
MNFNASVKRVVTARAVVEGLIADNTVGAVLRVHTGCKMVLIDIVGGRLQITAVGANTIWDAYQAELEEEGMFLGLMGRSPHDRLREGIIRRLTKGAAAALTRAFGLKFRLGDVDVADFEKTRSLIFEAEFAPEDLDRILLTF